MVLTHCIDLLPNVIKYHLIFSPSVIFTFIGYCRPGVPPRKAIVGSPAAPDDLPSSDEESSSDDDKSKIISPTKEVSSTDTPNISFQVRIADQVF